MALDLPKGIDELAPNLRWVQAIGAGIDHLHDTGLSDAVVVTNAVGVAAVPDRRVRDRPAARRVEALRRSRRAPTRAHVAPTFGRLFDASTVGARGAGRHRRCGRRARPARSARTRSGSVAATSPVTRHPLCDELFGTDSLHEVLGRCDAVVLSAPATPDTREHVRRGRVRGDEARRGVLQRRARVARRRGRADRRRSSAGTSAPRSSTSPAPSRSLPTIRSGTRRTSTSPRTRRRRRTATSRRSSISSPTTSAATRVATTCATWSTCRRATDAMGRYGFEVIDADGHGGEPLDWRRRIPDRFRAADGRVRARAEGPLRDHRAQRAGWRHAGERRQPRGDHVVRRRLRARPAVVDAPGHVRPRGAHRRHGPRGHRRRGAVPARHRRRVRAPRPRLLRRAVPHVERRARRVRLVRARPHQVRGEAPDDRSRSGGRGARTLRHRARLRRAWCARSTSSTRTSTTRRSTSCGRPPNGSASRSRCTAAVRRRARCRS